MCNSRDKNSKNKLNGSNNKQINGDVITNIQNFENSDPLTRTDIYELLVNIDKIDIKSNESYDIKTNPAMIIDKLEYNKAFVFKDKIAIYQKHLINFEMVMSDFENSERIVDKIKSIYIELAPRNDKHQKVNQKGDEVIDTICEKLKKLIKTDHRSKKSIITEEKIDEFLATLTIYCVERCQILLNPNSPIN